MSYATAEFFQVVCAWPVSGQYGPGSRMLYYVLVAACLLGRQALWLRNACLAAALLLPAVAALHGIVLAVVHVDGAVDMDVYGAFQLCAIGVLAGPVTVKLSQTYFNTPGRNMIFVWTGMILAGLLSLTVEFFRVNTVSCSADDFSWGATDPICGLNCVVGPGGPTSPLRGGSQNNIYVIKAPDRMPFGTATLLSAACCIPAILSLISTWTKIQKVKWRRAFGNGQDTESLDLNAPISGTNNATPAKMMKVNDRIRFYLSMVEIPVFGAAILAILILGERNFFSYRVGYMTEPIASIGQWSPVVATGLAVLGSLYALLAADAKEAPSSNTTQCNCAHHHHNAENYSIKTSSQVNNESTTAVAHIEEDENTIDTRRRSTNVSTSPSGRRLTITTTRGLSSDNHDQSLHLSETLRTNDSAKEATRRDGGSRRAIAGTFEWIGQKLGNPAPGTFDDSEFQTGLAADYPSLPAEELRNADLPRILANYNPLRDSEGHATPHYRQRSRAGSFVGSVASGLGIDGEPPQVSSLELQRIDTWAGPSNPTADRHTTRRATLQVPKQVYHSPAPRRESVFVSTPDSVDETEPQLHSPIIRISQESESFSASK